MFRLIVGVALVLGLSAGTAAAQQTVTVSGTVKDASGAVLPGVRVIRPAPAQPLAAGRRGARCRL